MIETMKYINFSHSINYLNTNIAITGVLVSSAVVIVVKELTITVQPVPSMLINQYHVVESVLVETVSPNMSSLFTIMLMR